MGLKNESWNDWCSVCYVLKLFKGVNDFDMIFLIKLMWRIKKLGM